MKVNVVSVLDSDGNWLRLDKICVDDVDYTIEVMANYFGIISDTLKVCKYENGVVTISGLIYSMYVHDVGIDPQEVSHTLLIEERAVVGSLANSIHSSRTVELI